MLRLWQHKPFMTQRHGMLFVVDPKGTHLYCSYYRYDFQFFRFSSRIIPWFVSPLAPSRFGRRVLYARIKDTKLSSHSFHQQAVGNYTPPYPIRRFPCLFIFADTSSELEHVDSCASQAFTEGKLFNYFSQLISDMILRRLLWRNRQSDHQFWQSVRVCANLHGRNVFTLHQTLRFGGEACIKGPSGRRYRMPLLSFFNVSFIDLLLLITWVEVRHS